MLTAPQVVLLFSAMTIGLMGLLLVSLARQHTKHVSGFSEWGAGLLLMSGSIISLFIARHILEDFPKALLGQTLVLIGVILCAHALRRFFHNPAPYPRFTILLFVAAFISASIWFAYVQPSFAARSFIFMAGGTIIVFDMLTVIYKNRHHGVGVKLLGAALLLLLVLRVIRYSSEVTSTNLTHIPVDATSAQVVLFIMPSVIVTISTLAFILMGSEKLVHKLNQIVRHDDLTDALNKRSLYVEIAREIERSIRYKHPLSVMMLDLDNFKAINDTLGHLGGDKILKEVVKQIRASVRSTDLVARFGGDEFAVLLTESDIENSHAIATRILKNIQQILPEYCAASIGISSLRSPGETVDSLLHRADQALYKAKLAGKNQYFVL